MSISKIEVVKTEDGLTLVAGYHRDEIIDAYHKDKDTVYFNGHDKVDIKKVIVTPDGVTIYTSAMQDIILKD